MTDLSALKALLQARGITIHPDFSDCMQREGSQWLIGRSIQSGAREILFCAFGDFKRGLRDSWASSESLSAEEKAAATAAIREAQAKNREAQEAHWAKLQPEIEREWAAFKVEGDSPYLQKKGLHPDVSAYGLRLEPFDLGARTIVPARDVAGKLWGYQRIFSKKLDLGDKFFRDGARKEGCFHALDAQDELDAEPARIFVAEGIATAISIWHALDTAAPVISCFDAGNLYPVAHALRERYPQALLVFCADSDRFPAKDGKVYYTGVIKAKVAADAVGNARIIVPQFKSDDARGTDLDDLRAQEGLDEVKRQLDAVSAAATPSAPASTEEKKPAPGISEIRLVNQMLRGYGDDLIRQGGDFFVYRKTHWVHLDPRMAPDAFKREIDLLAGGGLKFKDIQSAYNRFFIHVQTVPHGVSMFSPNPLKQNFKNGTLNLLPESNGNFKITFHEHRREDYLVHCHDFDYQENAPLNSEFEASLDRIWGDDPDKETKKQAYFEVLGACLVSAFRKIVVFVGPPKAGKSTLILFAMNMVHKDYCCSVDPSLFKGFNLESMAGKLLNYDTDINLVNPITDSILKKIEDRSPMRISRKNIADIYAPIPGMHLFGANQMPKSQEAGSAYNRRMLVFRCEKFQPAGDDFIQDYAQHVWRLNPQGILARAIEGLKRLSAKGGHFTIPESSRYELEQWQAGQGDLVEDFLRDIKAGGGVDLNNKLIWEKTAQMPTKYVWECFKVWVESCAPRSTAPGKIKFYARLKQLGIRVKVIKGVEYFEGFCSAPTENSLV